MTDIRVGFVGLGDIGKPMAARLASQQAEAGLALTVFDLAPGPVDELVAGGAKAADSVAALAADSDVLCVMVNNDQQVRSVLDEVLAVPDVEGLTVAVHSTVAPGTPGELASLAEAKGVRLVDAPVSGGAMGAGDGRLAIMVGGTQEAYDAALPVLAAMAAKVLHAGPIGAGTRFKLARNMMHFVAFTAATEAQRLAEAAGLDIVALGDIVRYTDSITGGPGAIMHRDTTAPIPQGDFWEGVFGHAAALGEKDLSFAISLADELGVDVPLARIAVDRLRPGLGLAASTKES